MKKRSIPNPDLKDEKLETAVMTFNGTFQLKENKWRRVVCDSSTGEPVLAEVVTKKDVFER